MRRALLPVAALLLAAVPLGLWPSGVFAASPTCLGKPATHVMHAGDPEYDGTPGDDVVVGSSGLDRIILDNSGGTDLACGGASSDFLTVSGAGSIADGGSGNDGVHASNGATARGGAGNDTVSASYGGTADGGSGNDVVTGVYADALRGGSGGDTVYNDFGSSAIDAGSGDDTVFNLLGGHPTVDCGSGRDTVEARGSATVRRCEIVR